VTTAAEVVEYFGAHHRAVLVTRRRDGRLQTSPIVCAADAGQVIISVTQDRAKTRNIRRDPRVTLCGLPDEFFGAWVQLDGTAEVIDLPEAMDGLVALYRHVQGEHPDWDEFRAAMARDRRCLLRITPDHGVGEVA
jgi:PPOX class probable F420-dependent enzyme